MKFNNITFKMEYRNVNLWIPYIKFKSEKGCIFHMEKTIYGLKQTKLSYESKRLKIRTSRKKFWWKSPWLCLWNGLWPTTKSLSIVLCKLRYLLDQLAKIQILNNFQQKFPALSYDEICEMVYNRVREPFWGRVPKFSIHFKETTSRDNGNFEESSKISINYCTV